MDTAAGLHSLESFTMAGIKEDQEEVAGAEAGVTEETVVYFTPGPEVSRVHVYTLYCTQNRLLQAGPASPLLRPSSPGGMSWNSHTHYQQFKVRAQCTMGNQVELM